MHLNKEVQKTIAIVIICQFIICLGMSLVYPVEPFIKNEYHFSAFDMGMMTALFALVQFIASPFIGAISDKIGRKKVMVWGLIIFALAEFIFAAAQELWVFNASRAVEGLSAAMLIPTSMALAADLTTVHQRAKVIGWLSAAFSGGLILGPGIGGLLAKISYKFPFWMAGVAGLISLVIALIWLPNNEQEEAMRVNSKKSQRFSQQKGWKQIKSFLTPTLITLFAMIFVASFGLAGFESIYSLFVNEVHHFGLDSIALVLTLNGIISLILQVFFFDHIVQKIGELRLIRYSYLLSALGTAIVIYDHSHWQLIVATLLVFEAFDLMRPAITTLLTKFGENKQGLINGINMSLTSVGNIVGPLISGALLDLNYHYPYLIVIIIFSITFILTFFMHHLQVED